MKIIKLHIDWSKLIPFENGSLNGIFQATSFLKGTSVPLSLVGRHGRAVSSLVQFMQK